MSAVSTVTGSVSSEAFEWRLTIRTWEPNPTSLAVTSRLNPVTTASASIMTAMPTATVSVAMRTMIFSRPPFREEMRREINSSVLICDMTVRSDNSEEGGAGHNPHGTCPMLPPPSAKLNQKTGVERNRTAKLHIRRFIRSFTGNMKTPIPS